MISVLGRSEETQVLQARDMCMTFLTEVYRLRHIGQLPNGVDTRMAEAMLREYECRLADIRSRSPNMR